MYNFWTRPYRIAYLIGLASVAGLWIGWQAVLLVGLASIDVTLRK